MIRKGIAIVLTILVGIFFVWSTYVKIESIDVYEITLVKQGLSSWNMSRFISRIFLAIELSIGLLLIFQYRLKKITLPITIGFITFLTLFLIGRFILVGNEDDCGCFGEFVKFSTLESIGKNVGLFLITFFLFKNEEFFSLRKWNGKAIISVMFLITLISIIIYQPPINIYKEFSVDNFKPNDDFPKIDNLPDEIYKGKSIIALFSPNCKHCKHAALKVKVLEDNNTPYNIYPVFGFNIDKIEGFMADVELSTPYFIIDKNDFLRLTQGAFPQLYILENGKIKSVLNKRKFLEYDF